MTAAQTIPSNPDELANYLTDDIRADLANDPVKMAEFLDGYRDSFLAKHRDTDQEFKAALEIGLVDWAEKNGVETGKGFKPGRAVESIRTGGLLGKRNKGQVYNASAPGAAFDKDFGGDVAKFLQMSHARIDSLRNRDELYAMRQKHADIMNAASSTVPSDGGFLIPEIFRSEIMQLALEDSIVRSRATVIPMESLKVLIPTVDETSRQSSIYGGVQFTWLSEGASGVDTSAKFGQVTLDAKKLMGFAGIPNELVKDAPAFAAWFGAKFPGAIGWFEDISMINDGDGTDKPLSILKGAGAVKVTRTTGSHIVYADIVQMYSQMYPSSHKNAVWVASHDTFPELAKLSFSPNGTSYVPVMLWQPNAVETPAATILGRPVIFTEKVPALGATGDLMYVDFSEYLIGDRQAMSVESSTEYMFGTDKTAFKFIERVDGRPWVQSPITPHNGSANTLSPYVVLN